MSFDKVPANAVKVTGVAALADAKATIAQLTAAANEAAKDLNAVEAELAKQNEAFKTALKDSDSVSKKYEAVIQHKATVEKAHAAALATKAKATQALSDARSGFLAAETAVERQSNTSKAAAALSTKVMDKQAAAQKAFDKLQAELNGQKADLAKAEKVLKKTPDDKRAVKEKAVAEKEIKKLESEVKSSGAILKKSNEDAAALKAALEKSDAGMAMARKALAVAEAKVDEALKLEQAAKKKLEETAANLAQAVKANAAMEVAAEEPSARIELLQRSIPVAKEKLQSARNAAADAKTELGNRLDVEEMLAAVLTKTSALLAQLGQEMGAIAGPGAVVPPMENRLAPLRTAVLKQKTAQTQLQAAGAKKELAAKASDLTDLITSLNSLADDVTTLIKDVPGLRGSHFKQELESFYHSTIRANLKPHVKAEDVVLPKTLEAQLQAAGGKGWSDDAIAKAQEVLTDKIKERINALHARGVEVAGILGLANDAAYKNLAGLIFEVNQLAKKDGSTVATARTALNALLAKQRRPSADKWRAYLGRNGIKEGSPGAGPGYHVTLKGDFLSQQIGSIDLAKDSNEVAMKKMFKLGNAILEIHASLESSGPINSVHYYFSGKYVGNPSATVKSALKGALDGWLQRNVEPLIDRARDAHGNLDML